MRTQTIFELVKDQFPNVQQLPVILTPINPANLPNPAPPAYRFFSPEGDSIVQIGPRMFAVNMLKWDRGYGYFQDCLVRATRAFAEAMGKPLIQRYSLGFYNRFPASSVEEVSELLKVSLPPGDLRFEQLVLQWLRETETGQLLSQISTMPPDERMAEQYVSLNNIFSTMLSPATPLDVEHWLAWIDRTHQIARDVFWEMLTPEAQNAWKESDVPTPA
jgi:uncharacterized protein (TIGR04255 family)